MLDNFEMPKRDRVRERDGQEAEFDSEEAVGEEATPEEESPLAVFSDEEILLEAQTRGLC